MNLKTPKPNYFYYNLYFTFGFLTHPEVVDFGHYSDFKEIWFDKYVQFRGSLKSKDLIPHFCRQ